MAAGRVHVLRCEIARPERKREREVMMEALGTILFVVIFSLVCAEIGMRLGHALACLFEWIEKRKS
jgi:hypothetical protein